LRHKHVCGQGNTIFQSSSTSKQKTQQDGNDLKNTAKKYVESRKTQTLTKKTQLSQITDGANQNQATKS